MSDMRKRTIKDMLKNVKDSIEYYGIQSKIDGDPVWDFSQELCYLEGCIEMLEA